MKQALGSAAFHSKEPVPVLQCEMKQEPVPVFFWHMVVVHEPSTILEAKDGAYTP